MKLGIIGAGKIVQEILPLLCELSMEEIYLLVRKESEEKGERLCRQYGVDGYYTDYEELLKGPIDVVYIALPNHLHYEYAKKALQQGKHVIVEKPMVPTVAEFDELCGLAKENGKILMEAINIPHLPAYQSLKANIGEIGTIKIVSLNFSQYSSRYDDFKEGKIAPVFDVTKAGGALADINVYNIHVIVGLFGAPKSVLYRANIERKIDTSGILVLEYEKFQVVAIGAKDCDAPAVSTLQGDRGCVKIEGAINQFHTYVLSKHNDTGTVYCYDEGKHRLYYEWKTFISILENDNFEEADSMLSSCRIVCDIIENARENMEPGKQMQKITHREDEEYAG